MKAQPPNVNGDESVTHPLAMRPRAAAQALGISERLLWDWTRTAGLPHVRIGNVVLYPVESVRRWLLERAEAIAPDADVAISNCSTGAAIAE